MKPLKNMILFCIVIFIVIAGCSYSIKNPGINTDYIFITKTYKTSLSVNGKKYYASIAYEKDIGKLEMKLWDFSDKPTNIVSQTFIRGILLYPELTIEHLNFVNPINEFPEGHSLSTEEQNRTLLHYGKVYVQKTSLKNLPTFSVWIWLTIKEKGYMLHYFYDDTYPLKFLKQIEILQRTNTIYTHFDS